MPKTGSDPDPRFTFANAPTFLAWNRTALALIAAGLAAAQFLKFNLHGLRLIIALPLIVLGAALALASYLHWGDSERAMRLRQPLHYSSRRSDAPVPCDSLLGTAVGTMCPRRDRPEVDSACGRTNANRRCLERPIPIAWRLPARRSRAEYSRRSNRPCRVTIRRMCAVRPSRWPQGLPPSVSARRRGAGGRDHRHDGRNSGRRSAPPSGRASAARRRANPPIARGPAAPRGAATRRQTLLISLDGPRRLTGMNGVTVERFMPPPPWQRPSARQTDRQQLRLSALLSSLGFSVTIRVTRPGCSN